MYNYKQLSSDVYTKNAPQFPELKKTPGIDPTSCQFNELLGILLLP